MKNKLVGIISATIVSGFLMMNAIAEESNSQAIAVVNVQQILQQSARVSDLSKQLEEQFKTRQQDLNKQQTQLQNKMAQLKKESPTMSNSAKQALQKKIDSDRAGLVKKVLSYQQDLNKEQNKIMQDLLADLNGVVAELAKKSHYNLVLDSQALVYAPNVEDITKQVSEKFNKTS